RLDRGAHLHRGRARNRDGRRPARRRSPGHGDGVPHRGARLLHRPERSAPAGVRAAMTAPLFLDAAAIQAACPPRAAVAAVEAALRGGLDPPGEPARSVVPVAQGQFLLMASEAAATSAGVKVVTVAPGNPTLGLPRVQAVYLHFDRDTLALTALLDGTALTTLRTPAVSVAAVRPPLPDPPLRLVVIRV